MVFANEQLRWTFGSHKADYCENGGNCMTLSVLTTFTPQLLFLGGLNHGATCVRHVEMRNAYKILCRKSQVKRPSVKTSCKQEEVIEADLRSKRCEDVDWTQLPQDRVLWWIWGTRNWTFGFHKIGDFSTSEQLPTFQINILHCWFISGLQKQTQVGLCFMDIYSFSSTFSL
jgi:hypothetical protein